MWTKIYPHPCPLLRAVCLPAFLISASKGWQRLDRRLSVSFPLKLPRWHVMSLVLAWTWASVQETRRRKLHWRNRSRSRLLSAQVGPFFVGQVSLSFWHEPMAADGARKKRKTYRFANRRCFHSFPGPQPSRPGGRTRRCASDPDLLFFSLSKRRKATRQSLMESVGRVICRSVPIISAGRAAGTIHHTGARCRPFLRPNRSALLNPSLCGIKLIPSLISMLLFRVDHEFSPEAKNSSASRTLCSPRLILTWPLFSRIEKRRICVGSHDFHEAFSLFLRDWKYRAVFGLRMGGCRFTSSTILKADGVLHRTGIFRFIAIFFALDRPWSR